MSTGKRVISCKELRESLAAYLDDRVTTDERERIESHLSACRQCSEEFASVIGTYDRIKDAAQALSDQITPSENIWLGIKSRLSVEECTADTAWGLARAKFQLGKEIAMKALFSKQPVWKLAAINGFVIIALVLGLTLGLPSSTVQTAYAQVEQIARDSQEVQDALGGEVTSVEAIRLQGDIGTAVCSGATGGMAAVTVDIGNQSVTDVSPLDLTQNELQRATDIAMNDSRVADIVDQGAVISDIYPGCTLGYDSQGAVVEILPNLLMTATIIMTEGDQDWQIVVNLDKGEVQGFTEVPKASDMVMPSAEDNQRGLDIAKADPEVQELLGQGATIVNSSVGGSMWTMGEDGTITGVGVMLKKGDSRWTVFVDLVKGEVQSIEGDPFAEITAEEEEELVSNRYAFSPLQVRDILDAVESNEYVRRLMLNGAEVAAIRPVLEWECDTANTSGMQEQVCHSQDGEVERVDVMLGMGQVWWDVILDLDTQEVVEITEFSYDAGGSRSENGSTSTDAGQSVDWATAVVSLAADDFYIEADGVKYVANVQSVDVGSDPGDSEFCTLELTWNEHGNEMRLLMYFVSDGTYWWSDEIRTYDGQSTDSDWIFYTGQFFKTKLGDPFVGDIDLTSDPDNNFDGTIHFEGLELQVFLDAD